MEEARAALPAFQECITDILAYRNEDVIKHYPPTLVIGR